MLIAGVDVCPERRLATDGRTSVAPHQPSRRKTGGRGHCRGNNCQTMEWTKNDSIATDLRALATRPCIPRGRAIASRP